MLINVPNADTLHAVLQVQLKGHLRFSVAAFGSDSCSDTKHVPVVPGDARGRSILTDLQGDVGACVLLS